MASSRRTPTNPTVRTYGGSGLGRDYTDLATWEAATDNALVSGEYSEILEVYNDEVFDDCCEVSGATCNEYYYRLVRPATGEGHDGTPGTGARFYNQTDTTANQVFRVTGDPYFTIQDLEISNDKSRVCIYFSSSNSYGRAVGCIGTTDDAGSAAWIRTDNNTNYIVNCLGYECAADCFYAIDGIFYNCTAVDCAGIGFIRAGGTPVAKNCASVDNSNNAFTSFSETTCYSGTATVFADQAGDDYHLDSTDTTCRGNGTDLSADGAYPFDDDVDGDTRSAWDIGFDEYNAGSPTDPNPPTTPYPADNGTGDGEDQTLRCVVTDDNGYAMDVSFYDESDDSLIGTDSGVASGGTATVVWEGLTPTTAYTWYAIADNNVGTPAQSADWDFTAGERSWKWYMSSDGTLREYVDGVKVTEATDSLFTLNVPLYHTTSPISGYSNAIEVNVDATGSSSPIGLYLYTGLSDGTGTYVQGIYNNPENDVATGSAYGITNDFFLNGNISGSAVSTYNTGSLRSGKTLANYYGLLNDFTVLGALTTSYSAYLSQPTGAGTVTNNYGLYIDDFDKGGTLNYSIYTGAGLVRFGDDVVIGSGVEGVDYTLTFNGESNDGVITWKEDEDYFKFSDDIMLVGGENIVLDTSTGTKIGTGTNQLLGFYNATPVDQPATVADAATQDLTGTDTINQANCEADLTSCKNAINAIIDRLQELGLIA